MTTFDLVHFLVYCKTMSDIKLNIHEAKTHLSRHLNEMSENDRLILCRRNLPVAEVRLLPVGPHQRQLGLAKGEFTVPGSFFEPLPADLQDAFEGE